MARFQAQTNAVLDEELSDLRDRLGLRENQKADLLREIGALAAWVIRQAEAGRRIEARIGQDVEILQSPALDRLRHQRDPIFAESLVLTDAEVERLAAAMARGFSPTPDLRQALSRLADPKRRPPRLRWKETSAA